MGLELRPLFSSVVGFRAAGIVLVALWSAGCQSGGPVVSNRTLLAHLPGVNFSGLKSMEAVETVKASVSVPEHWKQLKLDKNALYTHQQWKAVSGYTGTGIIYVHMPMAFSAKTVIWLAKMEYSKRATSGKALGEWTDDLGRPWFEAENEKYHVRGYAVTDGLDAWLVYYGYKTTRPPDAAELSLAARSVDTVVPATSDAPSTQSTQPAMAESGKADPQKKG